MKQYLILISVLIFFGSCSEDVSRNIETDLTKEADQFFQFSEALSESSYIGNISFGDYARVLPEDLPGCPKITRNIDTRKIELDYSNPQECEEGNKTPRSGKIILDFSTSTTANPSWKLTYADYSFGKTKIDGVRIFLNPSIGENRETFENLRIELEKNLGFSASGSLSYSVARLSFRPFAMSTRGRVEGKNPAGRDFSLVITEAKEQLFSCYREGWALPQSGKETWIISRGNSRSLDYMVRFEKKEACNTLVTSTLPDGRTLQLNP
ncbi:hypothetical protein [Algoriphagus sp.]|uniref:hypothetical protein n=1 Tax=Algoriphagus sp. TaxID=1872435 RepID=UPI00391A2C67